MTYAVQLALPLELSKHPDQMLYSTTSRVQLALLSLPYKVENSMTYAVQFALPLELPTHPDQTE